MAPDPSAAAASDPVEVALAGPALLTHQVEVVHVVAKTHLDLGFTALAAEVEQRYREEFFPQAVAVADALRCADGAERLVWTTGSWILHRALAAADAAGDPTLAGAVARGDVAWHALPFTTHTELLDPGLVRAGLRISRDLERRFDRPPVAAAKLTDVPGHTRGLVPLLAEAGVTFLHIGVNPAWPVPDVPPLFRWRSPDGAEVTVAYQGGGYGGEVAVDGCEHALAFVHAGDNLGPPTVADVVDAHRRLAERFPGAQIRGSTLDAFARALAASGAEGRLPVVTAEIGDPWLFGAGSDPQKLAAFRHLLALRDEWGDPGTLPADRIAVGTDDLALAVDAVEQALLPVAEHTWGLDQKVALPTPLSWDRQALEQLRATPAGLRFEASWAEQRAYVADALAVFGDHGVGTAASIDDRARDAVAWVALHRSTRPAVDESGAPVGTGPDDPWELALDPETGALALLVHRPTGRVLAGPHNHLGLLSFQAFDEADYERFYRGLAPIPDDEWWARLDNTKPGIDASGARAARWTTELVAAWRPERAAGPAPRVVAQLRFPDVAVALGAPPEVWVEWSWAHDDGLGLRVVWPDKPADRRPGALWCSFVPQVAEPDRWMMDKLGQAVSPLDVVRHGGRALHAVGEGVAYDGPDGRLRLCTPDAPLVAPGSADLLCADPPVPAMAGGWHVLLHDNCWGTNFPMWNEGPAQFRFQLSVG